jgi:hypothetical protein
VSLDLWLTIDTGGPEPATVWDDWNMTHNVNRMYEVTLGTTLGTFLEGRTAAETLPRLTAMLADMLDRPGVYRALNPPNGWGSYDTLLPRVRELVEAAQAHPLASWGVWR